MLQSRVELHPGANVPAACLVSLTHKLLEDLSDYGAYVGNEMLTDWEVGFPHIAARGPVECEDMDTESINKDGGCGVDVGEGHDQGNDADKGRDDGKGSDARCAESTGDDEGEGYHIAAVSAAARTTRRS